MAQKKETLDDIVFENRNKEYGAYFLRKNRGRYLLRAALIGTSMFALILGGAFTLTKINEASKERAINVDLSASLLDEEKPEEELIIPEELPPPPLEKPPEDVAQEKFLPPEPKKDDDVKIEEPPPPAEKLERAVISSKTVVGVEAKDVFIPPPPPKEVAVVKVETPKEEEIYMSVEEEAQFPGGQDAMYKFLYSKINYPAAAQRANKDGKVVLQFVVEKDGSIGNVKVLKGIGFGCEEEAMRVVKLMPKWSPGRQNGRPVRVYFNLPVTFTLSE